MCPQTEFGGRYRSMIETYRLNAETTGRQLDTILKRFYAGAEELPKHRIALRKGGEPS